MTAEDSRHRPVVFQTRAEPGERLRRQPMRVLAGATLVLAALAGATGLALGGSAVWSGVGPKVPNHTPAPLWPMPVTPTPALADHSTPGTHTGPTGGSGPTSHHGPTTAAAPTTEPTGNRHRGGSGTNSGGGTSGGASGGGTRGGSSGRG